MPKKVTDFRGSPIVPGVLVAYVRRGSDGVIFLQKARVEEVFRTEKWFGDDETRTVDAIKVRARGERAKTLTRLTGVAVL